MTRKEAEEKIEEKWGFLPYGGITLSLYEMDDEVPDGLVEYELERNPFKPSGNFMVCSSQVADAINEILNEDE